MGAMYNLVPTEYELRKYNLPPTTTTTTPVPGTEGDLTTPAPGTEVTVLDAYPCSETYLCMLLDQLLFEFVCNRGIAHPDPRKCIRSLE